MANQHNLDICEEQCFVAPIFLPDDTGNETINSRKRLWQIQRSGSSVESRSN
jgi:hypothetical protein